MKILDIISYILIILSAEAILRVIDYGGEIKDKLTSLLKLNTKSKSEVDLSEFIITLE